MPANLTHEHHHHSSHCGPDHVSAQYCPFEGIGTQFLHLVRYTSFMLTAPPCMLHHAQLEARDLAHSLPCKTDNSFVALAESWVAPSDPANTSHKGGMHHSAHEENPLEIGADVTPANSVSALISSWVGPASKVG